MIGASRNILVGISIIKSMELGLKICLLLALNARTVSSQGRGSAKLDLVIMLDTSGSVGNITFHRKFLTFCKNILATADIDSGNVQVGILSFSHTVNIAFNLNRYLTKLKMFEALERITYNTGDTNTADALKEIHTKMFTNSSGDRDNVPNVVIMLTDGETSNVNSGRRMVEEVNTIRKNDIAIYAVVSKTQSAELKSIVTPPTSDNIIDIDQCHLVNNFISRVLKATYPEPLTIVSTLYVKKGNPVKLQCNVFNNQTEVHWKQTTLSGNNTTVKLDVFNISSMNYSDEGTYICYTGNSNSTCQTNSVVLKLSEDKIPQTISNAEIDKKVLELKKTLEIRKDETARYRSMKTSATDDRLSSAVMGYIGVMVIVAIISLFVFFDCLSLWQYYYDT